MSKRISGGWFAAILLGLLSPGFLLAQAPQISFSEMAPSPLPESFHSTQCYFPPASPLTPREPANFDMQPPPPPREAPNLPSVTPLAPVSSGVVQASCSSCSSGLGLGSHGGGSGCDSCGGRLPCYPGRKPFCGEDGCHVPPPPETCLGRFLHGLYECLCCPDPCYEGKWTPITDSAFHVPAARPVTQQRLRWNVGLDVMLPDRAEFFWARADGGPGAKGPPPPPGANVINRFRFNDIIYSFEAAAGMASVITEMPYRSMDLPAPSPHFAGFGDIKVGLKTMLFDCELLQVSMQMLTYTPSGSPSKGLGVGHVSLEPSLLVGLRLGHDTHFQHQLAEWIPLGGDPDYSGAILHTHSSLNHVLYRCRPDVLLIGTAELNTWSFQDGAYTDPVLGPYQGASGTTYFTMGPGLRLFICDRIDFGFAASYALNTPHFWAQFYSTEFRWRF
jgi:hypothetical protein